MLSQNSLGPSQPRRTPAAAAPAPAKVSSLNPLPHSASPSSLCSSPWTVWSFFWVRQGASRIRFSSYERQSTFLYQLLAPFLIIHVCFLNPLLTFWWHVLWCCDGDSRLKLYEKFEQWCTQFQCLTIWSIQQLFFLFFFFLRLHSAYTQSDSVFFIDCCILTNTRNWT